MATQNAIQRIGEIQKQLEFDVADIKKVESEFTKVATAKQQLIEKKSENEMVLSELSFLSPDASVFKLVGPILAKQEMSESKSNVQKRIEFIQKEILRMDQLETDFTQKVEDRRKDINKLQDEYRKIMTQAQQAQAAQAQAQQVQQ